MNKNISNEYYQNLIKQMNDSGDITLTPINLNLDDDSHYRSVGLTEEQQINLSGLMNNLPLIGGMVEISNAYKITFPQGLPHTLMKLRNGGYTTQIVENGRILGTASLSPMIMETFVFGAFTAMSIASGQYFLSLITKELRQINKKIDDILNFLYGDKQSELLSELRFIQDVISNYSYIMPLDIHRISTSFSIQESVKVATKDMDFYLTDFEKKVDDAQTMKDFDKLQYFIKNDIDKIKNNLELSEELFLMSKVMEVYYTQNFDKNYIDYVANSIKTYIQNINDKLLSHNGKLEVIVTKAKKNQKDKHNFEKIIDSLAEYEQSVKDRYSMLNNLVENILYAPMKKSDFFLNQKGELYMKQD